MTDLSDPVLFEECQVPKIDYRRVNNTIFRTVGHGDLSNESSRLMPEGNQNETDLAGHWWLSYLRGDPELNQRFRGQIGVADLFCGSGGLSLGAKLAANALGLETSSELAVDIDPDALAVHAANHRPRFSEQASVADLVRYRISETHGRAHFETKPEMSNPGHAKLRGSIDLLLAGPPCQGHSTFNNRTRFNDPRNLLYLAVPAVAVALDIPAIVIENVPGVTASREGVVSTAAELLKSNGYEITHGVLNAASLGWPQTRRRFFLIATKGWSPIPIKSIEVAMRSDARPLGWVLEDVIESGEISFMTERPILSAENIRRINYLHDENLQELPNSERPDCHKDGHTYPSVYGRLWWDRPAPTITTGFVTPGRGRFVHPTERRTLLAREAARIQGFPDSYEFRVNGQEPSRKALAKGIGDAVPAPLGFAVVLAALANR